VPGAKKPSQEALAHIDAYMKQGGTVLFDTRDAVLAPPGQGTTAGGEKASTSVTLFDQGLVQVLEAAVTGLEPGKPYVLALANEPSGAGALEPLQGFMTNPAGSAIVNAIGPIRQVVQGADEIPRRYLVIVPGTAAEHAAAVQVQSK